MTIFFKATRTDGTDFYTGEVDYAAALTSGEPLPELSGNVTFPGPGWYHLATVPTECAGMEWPCKLYEVEPVGDVCMDNSHPHKIGARSVRVLREIDAHRVFGPQGEQVAALIERCRTLSAAELDRLGAGSTRYAALYDARYDARYDALNVARYDARYTALDVAEYAVLDAAQYAATWDAALGLLCRDLIGQYDGWDQAAYDLVTGPWRDVIGPIHPDDGDGDLSSGEWVLLDALEGDSDD